MKMAVFTGCQVVLELSTAVKFKEKQKLRKLVTDNGGIVSFIVTKKSTHVVCDNPEKADTSYKCRMAMKYGIPVVSPRYLQHSVDTGVLQKTDDFIMAGKSKSETLREGKITASKYQKTDKKKAVKPFINVNGFKVWNETDKNCPEFAIDYQIAKFAVFQSQKKVKNKTVRSFVVIEVHVDDSFIPNMVPDLKHKYRIACQSGTLELVEKGEDGLMEYRFCATVDEALAIYSHLYNLQEQKGMDVVFNVFSRLIGSEKFRQMTSELGLENTDISQPVKDLVRHIWQEAQGELDDIISETVTDTEQVDKAEAILKQIKSAFDCDDKSKVKKLMADFYGIIPHQPSKRDMSCSKMWLSRKQDLCQLIRDMLSVSEATDWSTTSSSQSKYKALRCVMEHLSRTSPEFQQMENLVTQSVLGSTKPTILNIFAVSRPVESVQYTSHLASKQLFHATKAENLVGILSRGLLLPRVVVDDHGGKRTDPGMLGAGIYFANSASTSIKYSHPCDTSGTRFMLINEVALGKTMPMYEKDTTLTSAPEGYQSVQGVRSSDGRKSAFQDDEFVIYNTNQQRMKYLVEFSLPDDKVKDTADDLDVIEDVDLFLNDDYFFDSEAISLTDVTNVTDPMSKVKVGLVSKSDAPVNLKAVHIRAKLLDLASEVVVLQEYENNSKTALEAKYVFPLGDLAAVCGFEAFINGKHIVGEVKEKEKAHKEYKKAISEGHGAYLMDQDEETPDIFTVSVGNLPPGACVLIKITYVAELQVEGELINFQLPGSVAPWKKQSLKEVTQHETESHEVNQGETSVQVAVDMPFDIRTIECPSHQIKVKRTLTKATVEMLENQSIADGFQLLIGLAEIHVPRMWVERKDGEPEHQACMLSFYPEFEACEVDDVNVVLLLDMSNSMKGDNLNNTKKIALLTLQYLPSTWNFNIVVFGTAFKELFPECVKRTQANINSASDFIKGLTATMGNTEVIRPMHTFYLLKPESMVQNVFLISDGHINNEEIMMKKAFENFQHTRIFTMGVGSTANRHLLRALSRVAAGAYEFFDPKVKSKWERKVKLHINKAAQPGLTSVCVDWEQHGADVSAPVQAPRQITALFSGSRQVIYGFVPNCTMATLHASIAGEEVSTLVSTSDLSITTGKILHRLTAKAIISDWEDGVLSADKTDHEIVKMNTKDYIIELSKEYSIVTQFTSFVAIEKRDKDEEKAAVDAPSMSELIERENVDQLAYMGFEEMKKTDLDYTHDIEALLINVRLNFDSKEKQNEFLHQAFKLTEQITDEHICSQNRVNLENAFFDWELSEQFDFETEFGFKPKTVKPPITVHIITLTGKDVFVEIDENCSIIDLKAEVEKLEGVPVDVQRLMFGEKQMDDLKTLKYYDIKNLDLLHLFLCLRGGGTGPEPRKEIQRAGIAVKKASLGLWQVPSMATARAKRFALPSKSLYSESTPRTPKLATKFARRSAPVAERITSPSPDAVSLSGSEDELDMTLSSKAEEEEVYEQLEELSLCLGDFDMDGGVPISEAISKSMDSLSDEDSDMMEEEGMKRRGKQQVYIDSLNYGFGYSLEDSKEEYDDIVVEECMKGRRQVTVIVESEDESHDDDFQEEDSYMMFEESTKSEEVSIEMEEEEEDEEMCFGLFDDDTIEDDKRVLLEEERYHEEEQRKKKTPHDLEVLKQQIEKNNFVEDLLEVQEVLTRNVDQVLERGEKLDSLVDKSEQLSEKSTAVFMAAPLSLQEDFNGGGQKDATGYRERFNKARKSAVMDGDLPPVLESTSSQQSGETRSFYQRAHRTYDAAANSQSLSKPIIGYGFSQPIGQSRAFSQAAKQPQAYMFPPPSSGMQISSHFMSLDQTLDKDESGPPPFAPSARAPALQQYQSKHDLDFYSSGVPQSQSLTTLPQLKPASQSLQSLTLEASKPSLAQLFENCQLKSCNRPAPPPPPPQFVPPLGGPLSAFGAQQASTFTFGCLPPLPHGTSPGSGDPPPSSKGPPFAFGAPPSPPKVPTFMFGGQPPPPQGPPPCFSGPPPPSEGPPLAFGAPPSPPKVPTFMFGGQPPPPQGPPPCSSGPPPPKDPALAYRYQSHTPQGPTVSSHVLSTFPRGLTQTLDRQLSPYSLQEVKPQRMSDIPRGRGYYSKIAKKISREDTEEEERLFTEIEHDASLKKSDEKPSGSPKVSWRKERSRSPDVAIDPGSTSSRGALLSSIKLGTKLKPFAKDKGAEKKKAAGKKYKENLMSSRLAEADFGTPLLDDYEELDVYQIDSLKSADNPPNTGPKTSGSPVLSDYGIGVQVPCIVRGKLDLTKKEEILTMIQYSQSKDGFWEIQPGSELEASLSIDIHLVEEVLSKAGLRSLGLSVYKDVWRIVSSVIVVLTVIKLYLPDVFPLDFNNQIIEEKVLSDFENAVKSGSIERAMMVHRAYEYRLEIDEKIPLVCKMLELGASWTHFVASMMNLHRETQEEGPVLYQRGLEHSQRLENLIMA